MTIFYVSEQSVLLDFSEEVGDDDFAGARKGAVLDEKAAAAEGDDHAVRNVERRFDARRVIRHLRDEGHDFFRNRGASLSEVQLRTNDAL